MGATRWLKAICAAWAAMMLPWYSAPVFGEEVRASVGSEYLCGPLCLLFICDRLQIPVDTRALLDRAGYSARYGTSFGGLTEACESLGLRAYAVEGPLQQVIGLLDPETYAIASEPGHFVVLSQHRGRVYRVDVASREISVLTPEGSTGQVRALIVSRNQHDIPDGHIWPTWPLLGAMAGFLAWRVLRSVSCGMPRQSAPPKSED